MLSENIQLNSLSYVAAQQVNAGSRSFLPVQENQYIYSQFEHVSGVPSEAGVSVSTLQILNSLVEHMIEKNNNAEIKKLKIQELTETQKQEMIALIQKKMQKQDELAKEIPYLKKAMEAGSLLSLQI